MQQWFLGLAGVRSDDTTDDDVVVAAVVNGFPRAFQIDEAAIEQGAPVPV